ncbi:dihydrofolate reductase [Nesterenkonia alkaliphila]|uniref:dihydrofolate reductase n=1 Tax=Nesterenkonia alkaliphila TaxID=1463631 RepID=A0A7K1ULA8_9MICC|nr:dihydrofolate reductase [Nesterenkonia alkaliphila]MVT27216.1 hypothetical protein [Nesterenkonia alkaliphila]GFZ78527.1 hypothetical protein GCM10011359_03520 [Nesterenkonia alkaliphila]
MSAAEVGMIWAQAHNGVIGADNTMPWHLPEDLDYFKATTAGCPVIMGRRTWESLPTRFRPLPQRTNIVVTGDAAAAAELEKSGAVPATSLEEALLLARPQAAASGRIWIMGGGRVYAEALEKDLADLASVTLIDQEIPGDTYAPVLDPDRWARTEADPQQGWHQSRSGLNYRFDTYRRRPPKKSAAAKIWGTLLLVVGGLFALGVVGNAASGRTAQIRAEMPGDLAYQLTVTVMNVLVLLLPVLGLWILLRKPKRR